METVLFHGVGRVGLSNGKDQEAEQAKAVCYVFQYYTFLQWFSQILNNKKIKLLKGQQEASQAASSQGMGAVASKSGYTKPAQKSLPYGSFMKLKEPFFFKKKA